MRRADGTRFADLSGTAHDGFLRLSSAVQVNAAGIFTFSVLADHPAIADLTDDAQIEHWWNDRLYFRALYQSPGQYTVDERDREIFTATCYGELDLLNRSIVAWKAGTQNLTLFENAAAESILYALVKYNATAEATTDNGRLVTYPSPHIVLEDDLGRGSLISPDDLASKPLLTALQEVAEKGGVDFDLVKVASRQWVFRVYPGQRGVDRSGSVVFSRSRRNVSSMIYNPEAQDPRTVAIVGGNGEMESREYVIRYGPGYTAQYHRELFVAQTNEIGGTAILEAEGDAVLDEKRLRPSLSFLPLQHGSTVFGTDYGIGDIVRAVHRDISELFKVIGEFKQQ
jgi:hypothetical protein